jgi:hypothetical protein
MCSLHRSVYLVMVTMVYLWIGARHESVILGLWPWVWGLLFVQRMCKKLFEVTWLNTKYIYSYVRYTNDYLGTQSLWSAHLSSNGHLPLPKTIKLGVLESIVDNFRQISIYKSAHCPIFGQYRGLPYFDMMNIFGRQFYPIDACYVFSVNYIKK